MTKEQVYRCKNSRCALCVSESLREEQRSMNQEEMNDRRYVTNCNDDNCTICKSSEDIANLWDALRNEKEGYLGVEESEKRLQDYDKKADEALTEENGYIDMPTKPDKDFGPIAASITKATLANRYDIPTDALPDEMLDFINVIAMGAKKYKMNNWLEPNGRKCSEREMHDSMFHHLAESFSGFHRDVESGLDPLLHLACRSMMLYTRRMRGIRHEDD
jgi:hypothetical protein